MRISGIQPPTYAPAGAGTTMRHLAPQLLFGRARCSGGAPHIMDRPTRTRVACAYFATQSLLVAAHLLHFRLCPARALYPSVVVSRLQSSLRLGKNQSNLF